MKRIDRKKLTSIHKEEWLSDITPTFSLELFTDKHGNYFYELEGCFTKTLERGDDHKIAKAYNEEPVAKRYHPKQVKILVPADDLLDRVRPLRVMYDGIGRDEDRVYSLAQELNSCSDPSDFIEDFCEEPDED